MDLLSNWFNEMLINNEKVIKERVKMDPFNAVPTPVVEMIFLTCCSLEQSDEVRYLSVELFDRFIRFHYEDLVDRVWNKNENTVKDEWKIVKKKLKNQSSLRVLSCIQLASKFVIHSKTVRAKQIQNHLKSEGALYSLKEINASEMRVWKTLRFKLNVPTVYTNVNLILERMKYKMAFPRSHRDIIKMAGLFTDVVYLHHEEIFTRLFYLSTGRWEATDKEKGEFLPTKCNTYYKAAAIVALAMTYIPTNLEENIYKEISSLSDISSNDIKALAKTINKIIF